MEDESSDKVELRLISMELGDLFVLIALMTRKQQLSVQFSDSAGNFHLVILDIFVQSTP